MPLTEAPAEARSFLARALRLNPSALVRLRPDGDAVRWWTALPFDVLATVRLPGRVDGDVTVRAADLDTVLPDGPLPARHDRQWRGSLPGAEPAVIEEIPAFEFDRIGEAAADTLRRSRGRGVGDRRLRDTLLDHEAVRVSVAEGEYPITVRLVVGLLRMGFSDGREPIRVVLSGSRVGIRGAGGTVWNPAGGLALR